MFPSLQLGIFLATIEVSIVSTALVDMANELQAFNNGAWIINAYLVAFTGTAIANNTLFGPEKIKVQHV